MTPAIVRRNPESPRMEAQTQRKRKKKSPARRFSRRKQHKTNTGTRICLGPGPQRVVKPTPSSPLSSDRVQSHTKAQAKEVEVSAGTLLPLHAQRQNEPEVRFSIQFPLTLQQNSLEDVEMIDFGDPPSSSSSDAPLPTVFVDHFVAAQDEDSGQPAGRQDKTLPDSSLGARRALIVKGKVRFSETDDIQPYAQVKKPRDVRLLAASTRPTSDKISFLRNPNMYDSNIRLKIDGSAMRAPVLLTVADLTDMEALWAQAQRLGKLNTTPDQVQFRLEEVSQPAGYDTKDDEKRFRFGKRANEEYPEFVKRCQEAARSKAEAAEELGTKVVAATQRSSRSGGTVRRSRRNTNNDVFATVDFIWR